MSWRNIGILLFIVGGLSSSEHPLFSELTKFMLKRTERAFAKGIRFTF
jgi:hypothetical protein